MGSEDAGATLPWFTNKTERAIFEEIGYACIYGIGPEGSTKLRIGYANDPRVSLASAQSWHWRPLAVGCLLWTSGKATAQRLKDGVQEMLAGAGRHLRGDWFDVPPDLATNAAMLVAHKAGIPVLTHEALFRTVRQIRERRIERAVSAG